MARPTPFVRQTSFTQFSSQFPAKPQDGGSLDAEFNAAKVALDETQGNLAKIQDDDGALKRGSVGRAQLDSSISLGFASPKPWQPDTSYTADLSTVFNAARFYTANTTHVSGSTFDSSKWDLVADLSASSAIDDGSITENKLAPGAATADKIGPLAVTEPKLGNGAVTGPKLGNGSVSLPKLADDIGAGLANLVLPAGLGPIPWPSNTAPTGWVFDGGTYSRDTYPTLAAFALAEAAAGNAWFGVGDGTTTFTITSAKGRALAGADSDGSVIGTAMAVGGKIGTNAVALTEAQLPVHKHNNTLSDPGHTHGHNGGWAGTPLGFDHSGVEPGNALNAYQPRSISAATTGITINNANAGSGQAHTNIQPSIGVRFIFKAH